LSDLANFVTLKLPIKEYENKDNNCHTVEFGEPGCGFAEF
jgi:hypothetical protein